jgi:hypothetical protein
MEKEIVTHKGGGTQKKFYMQAYPTKRNNCMSHCGVNVGWRRIR